MIPVSNYLIVLNMIRISIVLGEGFPLLSLSLVTEPLRVANRESPTPLFDWRLLSVDGNAPRASSGYGLAVDGPLDEAPCDVVLLLASYTPERMRSRAFLAWLRRRARAGCLMGCVDTGALLFAEAGLLTRRPAAAHPEAIASLREGAGPDAITDKLFDLDGDRCSSAGCVVTLDMTLALIARYADPRLAQRVAGVLLYRPVEAEEGLPRTGADLTLPRMDRTLVRAVEMMQANMENPISIAQIARRLEIADWHLRRLFQRQFGKSAQAYYLDLRLGQARNLLRNSTERVGTIAMICGFPATESLSRAYKAQYGLPPSADRESRSGAG